MELSLDQLRAIGAGHLPGLLGIEITTSEAGLLIAEMEVRGDLLAPNGYLHGGAVMALADTCCGYGAMATLPDGASGFTTIELKSNFVGTARAGKARCEARLVHGGRTTQLWQAEVTRDNDERSIAHVSCTQLVIYPE